MHSNPFSKVDQASTGDVDLTRIGQAVWSRRWWVFGSTAAALLIAAAIVNIVKPRYTGEAKLLLEIQENFLTREAKPERAETAPDAEAVGSQIQMLQSRDLARRVIKSLGLQGNVEFDPLAKGLGPLTRALVMLGVARDPTQLSPEDRMLTVFGDKLTVLSPTKTRILTIEFSSQDADLAARGANAVAETYIDMQQEAKRENARAAAKSLGSLVADLKSRVAQAEETAEDYRLKSNLLVGSNNTVLSTQQLGEIAAQLSNSRASQADAYAKARLLREMLRQNRVGDIPDVANNELIRKIHEQRVTLRAQLALESRTLLPAHPRIKELTAQLADLDGQWRTAAERTARTLENDARIAGARVENLTRAMEEQKKAAGAAGSEEVHLRELERAAKLLREQLEAETAKYQEALAREGVKTTPADARVVQRALAPQLPAFPKKLPITAFATIAAFIVAVGAIVAGELLGGRARVAPPAAAREPQTIDAAAHDNAAAAHKDAVAVAPLAAVSAPPEGDDNPEPPSPSPSPRKAPAAKPERLRLQPTQGVRVLVAGLKAFALRDGAVALARALSEQGQTLLIGADCGAGHYDSLVTAPQGQRPPGLGDFLCGGAGYGEIVHRDLSGPLDIVPCGARSVGDDMRLEAMDTFASVYDFVVVASARPETIAAFAAHADLTLVQGASPEAQALRAELQGAGIDAVMLDDAETTLAA